MNVIDYCKGMEMELIAWKAKMYDLTRKVESLGSKEREKVLPNIQDLNMLVTDMSSRIEQLKNECPTEWTPQKKDIETGHIDMRSQIRTDVGLYRKIFTRVDSGLNLVRQDHRKGLENFSEPFYRFSRNRRSRVMAGSRIDSSAAQQIRMAPSPPLPNAAPGATATFSSLNSFRVKA